MAHTTHLAVPVFADSVEALREAFLDAIAVGASLIELRLDLCEDVSDDDVRSAAADLPTSIELLLTYRSVAQGGACDEDDATRLARVDRLAPAFDLLDVELETWRSAEANREIVRAALAQASDRGGEARRRRLLLSVHDFRGRPASMQSDLLACIEAPECDIVKVAWQARSVRDCFEAFEIAKTCPKPVIALCMGELGIVSRLVAPKFGAFATFAALEATSVTAPGQPPVQALKSRYRWDALRPSTAIYGVIGHPVAHSLSPAVHNAVFDATGRDAVYVPLGVAPGYESLKAFLLEVESRRVAGFAGFSVTIPHKEHVMRFLREHGGSIDAMAERIGAVNTLAYSPSSGWRATNTDAFGAAEAIRSGLGLNADALRGLRVTVLGAGGVGRAVVAAMVEAGAHVTLTNRTPERASLLAEEFGVMTVPWPERSAQPAELIVNCTSAGMAPDTAATPWPGAAFPGLPAVFDTIYAPAETQMLRDARNAGCRVVGGLSMFAAQAAAQRAFWMGGEIDVNAYLDATLGATAAASGK